MGGRKQRMKRGQTIVAERERVESDLDRMRARRRVHRRHVTSVVLVVLLLVILGLLAYMGARGAVKEARQAVSDDTEQYEPTTEIVDESGRDTISVRIKQYIGQLERDFRDLGYTVTRVVLPVGTVRELYVDLEGVEAYFKVSIDRGAAVSVEDAVRMLKYLQEKDLKPGYVDVRLEGKAYYK